MKEKFDQLLSDHIKPLMKEHGYSKKGTNFYKKKDELIYLFNFQLSQGNTSGKSTFYINCAIHSTRIDKIVGGKILAEPKEYECHFRERIRAMLATAPDAYIITEDSVLDVLGKSVTTDLRQILAMFDEIQSTDALAGLMIDRNGLNNYRELFEYLLVTENMRELSLYVKQLHTTYGNEKRWAIFEHNLAEILTKHNRRETIATLAN